MTQDEQRAEADRLDYERSLAMWQELVAIRFQLLGLLPVVSGAVLAVLEVIDPGPEFLIGPSLLGLAVTIGITVYEIRNSQIHDNLINRLKHLERLLGFSAATPDGRGGFFSERTTRQLFVVPPTSDPSATSTLAPVKGLKARHDAALAIVYGAVLAAWAAVAAFNVSRWSGLSAGLAWWPAALVAALVGVAGWRIVSALSRMGRNRGMTYELAPVHACLSNPERWTELLHAALDDMTPPVVDRRFWKVKRISLESNKKKYQSWLNEPAYLRDAARVNHRDPPKNRDFEKIALSLGVLIERRKLSKRGSVRDVIERNEPDLLPASRAAIVGLREVEDAIESRRDPRAALVRRYGSHPTWTTRREVTLREEWLRYLKGPVE